MKHLLSILLFLPLMCMAQHSQAIKRTLPSQDELAAINDSILHEGQWLYIYEKLSWMTYDLFAEHATVDFSNIDGSAVQLDDDNGYVTHFYCSQDSVVFSCTLDLNDFSLSWDDTIRPMTEDERDLVHLKSSIINSVLETYRDSIYTIQDAMTYIDLICFPNKIRVYLLQKTTLDGVIPFGNDCYVDIDIDNNLTEFHRFHHSYIPIDISQTGEDTQAEAVIHSHTADNPYFTPTDICNALLYARDAFDMKSVCVLSTAFDPPVIMTFNMDDMSITVNELSPQ